MPWGGSEKHQSAYKRGQASKGQSLLYAWRLQNFIHSLLKASLTCAPGDLCPAPDYGAVEVILHWAHPLEMLSFGQGDLIVNLCHWWRTQTQTCRQLPGRILQYGNVCWEVTLKTSEEHDGKWSSTLKTSARLDTKLPGNRPEVYNTAHNFRKKSSQRKKSNKKASHYRPKPFMGRGSQSVTTPPWSCKVTLWTLAVSLLLLSAMITPGSPTPVKEGLSDKESDNYGTIDPTSMDLYVEENVDQTIHSPGSPVYDNITSRGHADEELLDNVLFRAERSPPGKKKNKKNGKGENGNKNGDCSRQSIKVKVRDLGLGYDSDELITFYYCIGTCRKNNNYDITLSTLLKSKHISHSSHRRVSSQPCCRPTSYLPVSFLDIKNEWQLVENLSAANCSCGS
ncbi:artemin [Engystomops pustulosus]|uniref:artemin n=1 Tax=Engystomops pustulosus TaxID=76066 RepID=UPI003AFB33EF